MSLERKNIWIKLPGTDWNTKLVKLVPPIYVDKKHIFLLPFSINFNWSPRIKIPSKLFTSIFLYQAIKKFLVKSLTQKMKSQFDHNDLKCELKFYKARIFQGSHSLTLQ